MAAIIRLVSVTATSDAGGAAHLGLPLRVWVPALTLAAIAFVFAAGLIDLLVRRADDPAAGLETALR
ncbi:MAG TPA: hypothetical protein VK576_05465, partial [Thermoleophilia bacterium]|nr:hypothetical protein [Thermoleophilia bacterium]